ncbi:MAG TPA: hypothetical protein VMV10_13080 [Pirellulales bacterium]|nr:hypothetical protein [Pirellulales bacterium]
MPTLFETVTNLAAQADVVRRRRYGVIEVVEGTFRLLRLRPFPKFYTPLDFFLRGEGYHRSQPGDRCLMYYNQPCSFSNFLALKYVVSTRDATLATFRGALDVLDQIAEIKSTDALLCEVANFRISDRLLARWGWAPHAPARWRRNYIKRFYGAYPRRDGGTQRDPSRTSRESGELTTNSL